MARVEKIKNLLTRIKLNASKGNFIILPHAIDRQGERNITVPDIVYALATGWHEPQKDQYAEDFKTWNYAIRGKTIDERELRIITSFDENNMLIITVIDLKRK